MSIVESSHFSVNIYIYIYIYIKKKKKKKKGGVNIIYKNIYIFISYKYIAL